MTGQSLRITIPEDDPKIRHTLSLPQSLLDRLKAYQRYVGHVDGRDIPLNTIMVLQIEQIMNEDKGFQRWLKQSHTNRTPAAPSLPAQAVPAFDGGRPSPLTAPHDAV